MDPFTLNVTSAEQDFYGDALILLEGAISEFLSCLQRIRRYQVHLGQRDSVASFQARIKRAESMQRKLAQRGLPLTAASALRDVHDAAGVRLICPFQQDIYRTAALLREIPGARVLREKDYIQSPKPNGYRSSHRILSLPLRFLPVQPEFPVFFEVQLRALAMDCWASIEHQLKYKQEVPDQRLIVQELRKCADEITSTDLSLETIRNLIEALR